MDKLVLVALKDVLIDMRKMASEEIEKSNGQITQNDIEQSISNASMILMGLTVRLISDEEVLNGISELSVEHINRAFINHTMGASCDCDVFLDLNRDTLTFVTKAIEQAKVA